MDAPTASSSAINPYAMRRHSPSRLPGSFYDEPVDVEALEGPEAGLRHRRRSSASKPSQFRSAHSSQTPAGKVPAGASDLFSIKGKERALEDPPASVVPLNTSFQPCNADTTPPETTANAEDATDSAWQCHICLSEATEPVVTLCGHLLCWSDLVAWWENSPSTTPTCPVCKALSGEDKVVPIYGRGKVEIDPRKNRRPRPRPNVARPRVLPRQSAQTGMQFHFGAFPFPGLGFTWQSGGGGGPQNGQFGRAQDMQAPPPMAALQLVAFLFMMAIFSSIIMTVRAHTR